MVLPLILNSDSSFPQMLQMYRQSGLNVLLVPDLPVVLATSKQMNAENMASAQHWFRLEKASVVSIDAADDQISVLNLAQTNAQMVALTSVQGNSLETFLQVFWNCVQLLILILNN